MEQIKYTVKLDLTDNGCFDTGWRIKQGDYKNCLIQVKLHNNGVVYYDEENVPEIVFKRADGKSVFGSMTPGNNDFYYYEIAGTELQIAGQVIMDVKFQDEYRTSSASCKFECVADTIDPNAEKADVYMAGVTLEDAQEIVDKTQEVMAKADEIIEASVHTQENVALSDEMLQSVTEMRDEVATNTQTASDAAITATSAVSSIGDSVSRAETAAASASASANTAKSDADRAEAAAQSLGPATTTTAGIVKPDGTTITVDADGTIHGNNSVEIVDNLISTSATSALSANQGRVLNNKVDDIVSDAWTQRTYNVGEYAIYDNKLWKCKVSNNVAPSEGSNWTQVKITSEFTELNDTLPQKGIATVNYTKDNHTETQITFEKPFKNVPIVFVTQNSIANSLHWQASVKNVTVNGFTLCTVSDQSSATGFKVGWVAYPM